MSYSFLVASVIMLALGFYLSNQIAGFVLAYVLLLVHIIVERRKK